MQNKQQEAVGQRFRFKINVPATAVRRSLEAGGAAAMLSMSPLAFSDSPFDPVLDLSDLDGSNGFVIDGVDPRDESGISVSGAGDVNGDGVDDVIVGARRGDPKRGSNRNFSAGESYVVFGGDDVGSAGTVKLSDLDGSDGFVINGIDTSDFSGFSVSDAGDINDDGIDDVIIGASRADPNGNTSAGESYVVFGGRGAGSTGAVELAELDGSDGFVINGIGRFDFSGLSVSGAGDVNGDGVDDLVIGAFRADPNGNSKAGESYVVFGGDRVGRTGAIELSSLDGSNGFVINGVNRDDLSGHSVSGAGDFNGDRVDDLIIGAYEADTKGNGAGASYVVFGGADVGTSGTVELSSLNGRDGFVINGIDGSDSSGFSVSEAGDINDDGVDDLIVGAPFARPNGIQRAGESYVLFGGNVGDDGTVDLSALDGTDGFTINGIGELDASGFSVSGAGDVNGDGVDDLIIGAVFANTNGDTPGASYVVFGGVGVGLFGTVELSALDGSNGFAVNGIGAVDRAGGSVGGAGDVNGDGVDDVIIGAYNANPNSRTIGQSYVIFGRKQVPRCNGLIVTVNLNLGERPGSGPDVILGTPGDDVIRGLGGHDTICGMGGDDSIRGNDGDDWIDGGDGVDDIRGGNGFDVLLTGSGATVGTTSRVLGGRDDDFIIGGPDADFLRGGRAEDLIFGNGGDDVIYGDANDDFMYGGPGADRIFGGQSGDELYGGPGADALFGGTENDDLFGEGGNDTLNGGSGRDHCESGGQDGDTERNC